MKRINVSYHGLKVGVLAEARGSVFFEYEPGFLATGHDLSPLFLKPERKVFTREPPPSPRLPGLFEDSLPDRWGRRVMKEWFQRQGTAEHAITPLMMLAYVGHRGMGALAYAPEFELPPAAGELSLAALHEAASQAEATDEIDLKLLAEIGSPAGGARPKALIALPRSGTGSMLPGTGALPTTHEAWLVKFDLSPDGMHSRMEEAYARMARACGVDVPETRVLETHHASGVKRHFAIRRFDRRGNDRIHHHTLAAMCQTGGGDLDYETLLRVTRLITKDEREVVRAFRRAVFNVLASNRDDHGKNHGFIYQDREWKLGPAYDLTFCSPQHMPERGLAVGGERRAAGTVQLVRLADREGLDRTTSKTILRQVQETVAQWPKFAADAGLDALVSAEIAATLKP